MQNRYAPHPIQDYFIKFIPSCEMRLISEMQDYMPTFNLVWLSHPGTDHLLHVTPDRLVDRYVPRPAVLTAAIVDSMTRPNLRRALSKPVEHFADWFSTIQDSEFRAYESYAVGGPTWAHTVLARANARINDGLRRRPVVQSRGGRLHINWELCL